MEVKHSNVSTKIKSKNTLCVLDATKMSSTKIDVYLQKEEGKQKDGS